MSQDKNRRKQEKDRRKKKKEAERAQAQQRKKANQAAVAYSTCAFAWPIKYRQLAFVKKPNFAEPFRLEGIELSLTWYDSLEDRRRETNGEIVTTLEILTCVPIPLHNKRFSKILQCTGKVHQLVKRGTEYGDWLNRQPDGESSEIDDYQATDVEFLISFTFPQAARDLARLTAGRKDQFTAFLDSWNVGDVVVADHTKRTASALALDRLFELLHMLRIVVPRRSYVPAESVEEIERRVAEFEAQEYRAGLELAPHAQASRQLYDDYVVADRERALKIAAAQARHAALDQELRALQAIPENTATDEGRARKARLHRLISDRGTAFATVERLCKEQQTIASETDDELLRLAKVEWVFADRMTKAFLLGEEAREDLRCKKRRE